MLPDGISRTLLNEALELFLERGYADVTPSQIAKQAGCSLEQLYTRYPRKESFVMGLYGRITSHLQSTAADTPPGTVAARFQFLMRRLLDSLRPYRPLLQHLLPSMLDPANRLGVLGRATDDIRAEVQGIYLLLVLGATDAPGADDVNSQVQLLYFTHLALIFLFLQDQHQHAADVDSSLELAGDLIVIAQKTLSTRQSWLTKQIAHLAGLPQPEQLRQRIDRLVGDFIHPPHDSVHFSSAENILRDLFRFRRLQTDSGTCQDNPCRQCLALHLPKVQSALETAAAVQLVLPAFPAKSPNLSKVLGPLPDLAEELAVRFLQQRCDDVSRYHEPGAQLTICSDGRVFSDLVCVPDADVTAYRHELMQMIDRLQLGSLRIFDLDDVMPDTDYDATRTWLMEQYGEPLEELQERTQECEHHQQLFNGIHRFMFEDLIEREPKLSRTQARKQSKALAYEVIRRSNAWSRLVSEFFPQAVRLSIHPHPPHSDKIGILLGDADDVWLTPWHGVALLDADRFLLTRKSLAEQRGAVIVTRNGRSSHYQTPGQMVEPDAASEENR